MATSSDAHAFETAVALEMAKRRLLEESSSGESGGSGEDTPETPPDSAWTGRYAFAFDIDGVLIRGGKPISGATEGMKVLNGQNEFGIKVEDC
jgi:hypothetical protein